MGEAGSVANREVSGRELRQNVLYVCGVRACVHMCIPMYDSLMYDILSYFPLLGYIYFCLKKKNQKHKTLATKRKKYLASTRRICEGRPVP